MLITHIAHKHLNRAVYEKGGDGGASKAQAKAQQQAIDLQREQWNTVMNNLKPYAEVGVNRPGFPGECFICELRLPDHRFRWKHNKLFL
ncbi:hypothetical protein G931_04559, partial [Escherichia coli UMEA 3176-1]